MLCSFCCGQPVAVMMPPLMAELPPANVIFSSTMTLAPAFLASIAAARPAKPVPTTITSTVSSHFGAVFANAGAAMAAVPAMEPAIRLRREMEVLMDFSFSSCSDVCLWSCRIIVRAEGLASLQSSFDSFPPPEEVLPLI